MRWTDLSLAFVSALWSYFLWAGISGLLDIKARNIPGYPASGQIVLYAAIPAGALLLGALSVLASRRVKWFYDVYPFAAGLLALAIFPILFVWGGGV